MSKLSNIFKRKSNGVADEPPQIRTTTEGGVESYSTVVEPDPRNQIPRSISSVVAMRRNGTPPAMPALVVSQAEYGLGQTLIIRYPRSSMLGDIKRAVRRYKHQNAQSSISKFIEVDVFVNIGNNQDQMRGHGWLSIVYECMEGNPVLSAINRYPGSTIVTLREVSERYELDSSTITLDIMLMEGRR